MTSIKEQQSTEGSHDGPIEEFRYRRREVALWITSGVVAFFAGAIPFLAELPSSLPSADFFRVLAKYAPDTLVLPVVLFLFPILFRSVFDAFPFEVIRTIFRVRRRSSETGSGIPPDPAQVSPPLASHEYSTLLAKSSRELAQRIYKRAGAHLLGGITIALLGVLFFYAQNQVILPLEAQPDDVAHWLMAALPRFGILVFIELIAFFLLKQYRAAMDEFRYFETVARRREEAILLFSLAKEQSKHIDVVELIKIDRFFSDGGKTEQPPSAVTGYKLGKNETALLEKVIEAATSLKKPAAAD